MDSCRGSYHDRVNASNETIIFSSHADATPEVVVTVSSVFVGPAFSVRDSLKMSQPCRRNRNLETEGN